MIFDTAFRTIVSDDAPCQSAGYSIAPTPTMHPCPSTSGIGMVGADRSRVGQRDRGASEVRHLEFAAAGTPDHVFVGSPKAAKSIRWAPLMFGTSNCRVPSSFARSIAKPRFTSSLRSTAGLPST